MMESFDSLNLGQASPASLTDAWTHALQQATAWEAPAATGNDRESSNRRVTQGDDLRIWRRQLFGLMSQHTEAYLRSPAFLLMLKSYVEHLISVRQRANLQSALGETRPPEVAGSEPAAAGRTDSVEVRSSGRDEPAVSSDDAAPQASDGGEVNRKLTADVKLMHRRLKQLKRRLDAMERLLPEDEFDDQGRQLDDARSKLKPDGTELHETPERKGAESPLAESAGAEFAGAKSAGIGASSSLPDSGGASHGVTPSVVVYRQGKLKLHWYQNRSVAYAQPLLICFALVNRPYILDLKAQRSVVRRLLEQGFDVYLIDWGIPDASDRHLTLEDYVCRLLKETVLFVVQHAGGQQVNLLGYCMGGTLATMFTALYPQWVRNLALMATPIDFSQNEGLLYLWSRPEYFNVDRLIDTFGNCPGELLQFCFQLMKPVQNFAEKQLALCENLADATYVDNFVAVERWANDSIPVAGEAFRQYVKSLFQENRLATGEFSLAGRPVCLDSISCPLLLLVAEKDHLVPPDSSLALLPLVRSSESRTISIDAGHVGLAVSSKAHRRLWPEAAEWLAAHSSVP